MSCSQSESTLYSIEQETGHVFVVDKHEVSTRADAIETYLCHYLIASVDPVQYHFHEEFNSEQQGTT